MMTLLLRSRGQQPLKHVFVFSLWQSYNSKSWCHFQMINGDTNIQVIIGNIPK